MLNASVSCLHVLSKTHQILLDVIKSASTSLPDINLGSTQHQYYAVKQGYDPLQFKALAYEALGYITADKHVAGLPAVKLMELTMAAVLDQNLDQQMKHTAKLDAIKDAIGEVSVKASEVRNVCKEVSCTPLLIQIPWESRDRSCARDPNANEGHQRWIFAACSGSWLLCEAGSRCGICLELSLPPTRVPASADGHKVPHLTLSPTQLPPRATPSPSQMCSLAQSLECFWSTDPQLRHAR